MTEFNLSEKIHELFFEKTPSFLPDEEDINEVLKEFIRLLEREITISMDTKGLRPNHLVKRVLKRILYKLNKLAGSKLTEGGEEIGKI